MSVQLLSAVMTNGPRHHTDFIVLLVLADFSDPRDNKSFPSKATIALRSRRPVSAVEKALRRLAADGYITVHPPLPRTAGRAIYEIQPNKLETAA